MNLTQHGDDTIAAISTPRGQGGIGIVRLSGPDALSIADRLFVSKKTKRPDEEPLCPSRVATHTVHYGYALDFRPDAEGRQEREMIDEVLLTVMRAPHSYTREDVVEISCHGGTVPLQAILRAAIALGARLSEPGEFTKRAFLNGRIDLSQAEAVLDVIRAKTEAFLKVSVNQLKGQLSAELESIREELMAVYTNLEAEINFPELLTGAEPRLETGTQFDLPVPSFGGAVRHFQGGISRRGAARGPSPQKHSWWGGLPNYILRRNREHAARVVRPAAAGTDCHAFLPLADRHWDSKLCRDAARRRRAHHRGRLWCRAAG